MNLKLLSLVFIVTSLSYGEKPVYLPIDVTTYNPIDVQIYEPVEDTLVYEPIDVKVYYPMGGDRDNDGVINDNDAFPNNPNEWQDTDHDGIGNNADTDDDNDGISDAKEKALHMNPLNPADAQADFDHDGFSNIIEINLGTNIRNSHSHPTWAPVIMGDIMIFIPAK